MNLLIDKVNSTTVILLRLLCRDSLCDDKHGTKETDKVEIMVCTYESRLALILIMQRFVRNNVQMCQHRVATSNVIVRG